MSELKNRYEFVILVELKDGNLNGDPDAANMPRRDPMTDQGLVTDVCIKHKIRNYVDYIKGGEPGYELYISGGETLNSRDKAVALNATGAKDEDAAEKAFKNAKKGKNKAEAKADLERKLRAAACETYYDVRTFGAVMTTFSKGGGSYQLAGAGQLRGPVQLAFGRSIDPIDTLECGITRCAVTKDEDAEKEKEGTMANKYIVPYGLYRIHGYVSPQLAEKTGFSEEDLELLWQSILNMTELDHAAARGEVNVRDLIIFKHQSALGECPAYKLFEAVHVDHAEGLDGAPRQYSDYVVDVPAAEIPAGVEVIRK